MEGEKGRRRRSASLLTVTTAALLAVASLAWGATSTGDSARDAMGEEDEDEIPEDGKCSTRLVAKRQRDPESSR